MLVVAAGLAVARTSAAQVTSYAEFKVVRFHQTGPMPPDAPDYPNAYVFGARVFSSDHGAISQATLTPPAGAAVKFEGWGPLAFEFRRGGGFGSKPDLDSRFPSGTYTFALKEGAETATLELPEEELYPDTIPAFAEESWNAMQAVDASGSFALRWNTFQKHQQANAAFTFIKIYEEGSTEPVFDVSYLEPRKGDCALPANVLKSGARYRIELVFSNRADRPAAGFGNALGTVGFDCLTYADLTTRPPQLAFSSAGGQLLLSWPVAGSDYVVEASDALDGTSAWVPLADSSAPCGDRLVLALSPNAPTKFFRLRKVGK